MSAMPEVNPDCAYGKHDACNGDAWDFALDEACACRCDCHRAGIAA